MNELTVARQKLLNLSPTLVKFLKTCALIAFFVAVATSFKLSEPQKARASIFGFNAQNVGLQPSANASSGPIGGGDISIVGDAALLPDAGPSGTAADISETPSSDQISIYVVRQGETLGEIAQLFKVTTNTIIWANDLPAKPVLSEGQVLIILPINGIQHTVAKGETLQSIAKKYKGDSKEIAQYNNLENNLVAVGQTLIIPDGEVTPPPVKTPPKSSNPYRGGTGPSYAGYYLRPIVGGVKTQGLHGYNGIDLASSLDTPILAAAGGTVIISRSGAWNGGYGNYVVIQHPNGTQTLYAHMHSQIVVAGQHVDQGQTIGYMGMTGKATGIHLHFEVRGAKNPF